MVAVQHILESKESFLLEGVCVFFDVWQGLVRVA